MKNAFIYLFISNNASLSFVCFIFQQFGHSRTKVLEGNRDFLVPNSQQFTMCLHFCIKAFQQISHSAKSERWNAAVIVRNTCKMWHFIPEMTLLSKTGSEKWRCVDVCWNKLKVFALISKQPAQQNSNQSTGRTHETVSRFYECLHDIRLDHSHFYWWSRSMSGCECGWCDISFPYKNTMPIKLLWFIHQFNGMRSLEGGEAPGQLLIYIMKKM